MAVIIIRGTLGSGKTTIVRNLVRKARGVKWFGRDDCVERGFCVGHNLKDKVFVVGPYDIGAYSGPDKFYWQIKDPAEYILDLLRRKAVEFDYVVMESLFSSTWKERFIELAKYLDELGHSLIIIQLTTPLKVCIDSVWKRRNENASAAPGKKVVPLEKIRPIIESKYRGSLKGANELKTAGLRVKFMNREEASKYVLKTLRDSNGKDRARQGSKDRPKADGKSAKRPRTRAGK